jgi:hypothetical protein
MKTFSYVVGGIIALLGSIWVIQGNDFFLYKTFAPKYEQVRRETFEQSHAFRQGHVQELQNMQMQYVQASPAHRAGLATVVQQRAGDIADVDSLPTNTRGFISCVRSSQQSGDFTANCAS